MRNPRPLAVLLLTLALGSPLYARHRSAPTTPLRNIEGVMKSLNATQLVITDEHNNDVMFTVTADTVFRKGDMAIAPTDINTGDRVEVKASLSGTTLTATLVRVDDDDEQEPQIVELSGSIKTVSPSEIVVTDANQHDTPVELTSTTIIRKGDQPATAADLAIGDRVEVKAVKSGTALNALLVKVEANEEPHLQLLEVSGIIKSVSATQIVVTDAQQHDTTFTIDSHTIIRKGDHTATVADLAVNDHVEVLGTVSGTTNTAVAIHAEAPEMEQVEVEISGTVKSVGTNSIVVTTHAGDVSVNVDANTRIRKNDRTIALTDIKVGDSVQAEGTRVDATTILARDIEVRASGGHH